MDEPAEQTARSGFSSEVFGLKASLAFRRSHFGRGRVDFLQAHEILPCGLRKSLFYAGRDDQLAYQLQNCLLQNVQQRFYDFLRLDGLKKRIFEYSTEKTGIELVELSISQQFQGVFSELAACCTGISEEFRDLGCIQRTVNSRRRRMIQGKHTILNAEQRHVAGIAEAAAADTAAAEDGSEVKEKNEKTEKAEHKMAFIQDEDTVVGQDTFADVETALTLAAYNIFVAQKQIFATNIASVCQPTYSIS